MEVLKKVLPLIMFFALLTFAGCGVNDGNAVTSGGEGPVPLVSADCSGDSCM